MGKLVALWGREDVFAPATLARFSRPSKALKQPAGAPSSEAPAPPPRAPLPLAGASPTENLMDAARAEAGLGTKALLGVNSASADSAGSPVLSAFLGPGGGGAAAVPPALAAAASHVGPGCVPKLLHSNLPHSYERPLAFCESCSTRT